jgi:pyruvate dehydrogenase E1 component alpha subunit
MTLNKEDLLSFEDKIADIFNSGKIKAPVHLYSGNEDKIIETFKNIKQEDWVFCSWRSHYQCLLKGVPETELLDAIMAGRSIALNFPKYKVFSSAIVAGQIPLALGAAYSLKYRKSNEKVFCFLGDMTSETGIAQSAFSFAMNFDLPITFIIEDNNLSVCTDTRVTWGTNLLRYEKSKNPKVLSYKYTNKYPHAGAGKRVQF